MRKVAFVITVAERLPLFRRVRLVAHLPSSLEKTDPEIDAIWADECEHRLDAYLYGEAEPLDAADVLTRHLKP